MYVCVCVCVSVCEVIFKFLCVLIESLNTINLHRKIVISVAVTFLLLTAVSAAIATSFVLKIQPTMEMSNTNKSTGNCA